MELTERQSTRKYLPFAREGWVEKCSLTRIEDLCSFSNLLPIPSVGEFKQFSDCYPELARERFQNAAEYFAGTGLALRPQRVNVLDRIIEVIQPLSLERIPSNVFPIEFFYQAEHLQVELAHIYNHNSNPLCVEIFKKYPRLTTDISHVYALSTCFAWVPPGIGKVLMHSTYWEKEAQNKRNLLASYVNNKGLTKEILEQARRAGLKIFYPKDHNLCIRFDLLFSLEEIFSRAILLGRFDEAHEIAQLAVPAVNIMKTKEPDARLFKATTVHWQFIRDNFPQLQKEVLYISGKRRNL